MAAAARRETASEVVAPGVQAYASILCDAGDRTHARMVAMAERVALPNGRAWLANRGTDSVHGDHAMFTNKLPARTYARVGVVGTEDEAREIVKGFGLSKKAMERDEWDPSGIVDMFYEIHLPHDQRREASGRVAVWAGRTRSKVPEGFLLCHRDLSVWSNEGRGLVLRYRLDVEYAYVIPKARRRGLAGALAIAVGDQVDLDVKAIREAFDVLPVRGRPRLETSVSGQAHSTGGEWVMDSLVETVEAALYLGGFPKVGCEPDYSL